MTEGLLEKGMRKVRFSLLIILFQAVISCNSDRLPYEDTFKKGVIENTKIEPIVEMITIDSRLDSATLKEYFKRELKDKMAADKAEAKVRYDKIKEKYDRSLKYEGKHMADGVYLGHLTGAKEKYEKLLSGVNDFIEYKFYYDRMKYPTVFEEVTVKFRLSKEGPLLVQRYRTDIFRGDTSFYELKGNRTITDYIK